MNRLGKVVAISGRNAKVSFDDLDIMSPFIKTAKHVSVEINDQVIVAMCDEIIGNSIIIGVIA